MGPYPYMNGTAITSDLSQVLVYVNVVTNGLFIPFLIIFFFCVTLITSLIMQQRFTGAIKFETSVLAGSFVTTGLTTLLFMNGLCDWSYLGISLGVFILALIWVVNSQP